MKAIMSAEYKTFFEEIKERIHINTVALTHL